MWRDTFGESSKINRTFSDMRGEAYSYTSCMISSGFTSSYDQLIVLDSILDISSVSLINSSKAVLFSLIMEIYCSRISGSSSSPNISEKPTMAFSGVRISCVIFARNVDFNRERSLDFWWSASSSFSFSIMLPIMTCGVPLSSISMLLPDISYIL